MSLSLDGGNPHPPLQGNMTMMMIDEDNDDDDDNDDDHNIGERATMILI